MTDNNSNTLFCQLKKESLGLIIFLAGAISIGAAKVYPDLNETFARFLVYGGELGLILLLITYVYMWTKDYYDLPFLLNFNYPGFIKRQIKLATRLKDDPLLTLEKINIWKRQVLRKIKDETHRKLFQFERMDYKIAKRYGNTDHSSLVTTLDRDIDILQGILKIVD